MLKMKTRLTWKMISDPLYGYVYFNTEIEEPIINHIILQRLRYIMQLQTAHLVYPGAVHTRFQHSIGVMHLAGLMAEDAIYKIISLYGEEVLDGYDKDTLIEATRLAGLLHDVGHAAFSHAFERGILWKRSVPREVSNHEMIGLYLVKHLLEDHLEKSEEVFPGLREVLYSILGSDDPRGILRVFRWIVKEGFYPADVLDFLRRDSYYAGTLEYGYIMYERLYKNTYPFIQGNNIRLVLDRIALGEFKQYMYAKANMYEHLYYHSVCRSFDKILYEILEGLDNELGLSKRVLDLLNNEFKGYLELTDTLLYTVMFNKAFSDQGRLGYLCRRLVVERKPEWKRVGREVIVSPLMGLEGLEKTLRLILDVDYKSRVVKSITEYVLDSIESMGINEDDLWIDVLDVTPLPKSAIYPGEYSTTRVPVLYIGKKIGSEVVISEEMNILSEELPLKMIIRAYVPRGKYSAELESKMTSILSTAVSKVLEIDLDASVKIIENIYAEYSSRDYSKYRITA